MASQPMTSAAIHSGLENENSESVLTAHAGGFDWSGHFHDLEEAAMKRVQNGRRDESGRWQELSGHARKRWTHLTEEDLAAVAGDRERLIEVLEERYPRTREVIEREVAEFYESVVDKAARDPDAQV
jgi:hypothetical protein